MDGNGLHLRWDGGSSVVEWKTFVKWADGKNQVRLYSSQVNFLVIPKRALDPPHLVELRALLAPDI